MIPAHFITAYEAADALGYHPDWMKVRIRAGEVPSAVKGPHNAWWMDPVDLDGLVVGKGQSFWEKVEKTDTCWLWTSDLLNGYGVHGGKLAHRLAYEELVEPIPDGLTIDHLCRNPPCVNPQHMEPVTRAENTRRAFAVKTHCRHNHEFTEANTYVTKAGHRTCRTCTARLQREHQARKKAS